MVTSKYLTFESWGYFVVKIVPSFTVAMAFGIRHLTGMRLVFSFEKRGPPSICFLGTGGRGSAGGKAALASRRRDPRGGSLVLRVFACGRYVIFLLFVGQLLARISYLAGLCCLIGWCLGYVRLAIFVLLSLYFWSSTGMNSGAQGTSPLILVVPFWPLFFSLNRKGTQGPSSPCFGFLPLYVCCERV